MTPFECVWERVRSEQGGVFHTATGLPFTYQVEGDARIWFYRSGRRINRPSTRSQFARAVERCPLSQTTDIKDLLCYAYVFGLLRDGRIRGNDW